MYAVIETGNKQYRVQKDDVIDIQIVKNHNGKGIEFKNVLLLKDSDKISVGKPYIQNSVVLGEILADVKGPKTLFYRYKKRKGYQRKVGHRQNYHRVKILEIKS